MRYFNKCANSEIVSSGFLYSKQSQRLKIARILVTEQNGFCAYSEKFFCNIDTINIEHFDPRLKNTNQDNYNNWYATQTSMNLKKAKYIDRFLPILHPSDSTLQKRITYIDGLYAPTDDADIEASNLIGFLGFNRIDLVEDRSTHIETLRYLMAHLEEEKFLNFLMSKRSLLSYATAIEHEFNIKVSELIR
jgi:hypothetical protein